MSPVIAALLPLLEPIFRYVWSKFDDVDEAWSEVQKGLTDGKITKADLPDLEADIAGLHAKADREDPGAWRSRMPRRNVGGFDAPDPFAPLTKPTDEPPTTEPPPPAPPTLRPEDIK